MLYLRSSPFEEEVISAVYPDVSPPIPQPPKVRATGAGLINWLTTFLFLSIENVNSKTALNRTSEQKSFKFTGETFKPQFSKAWERHQIHRHGLFGVNRPHCIGIYKRLSTAHACKSCPFPLNAGSEL